MEKNKPENTLEEEMIHEENKAFVDLVEIGEELVRVDKQLDWIAQMHDQNQWPQQAVVCLTHSYNAQLCDAYHLFNGELLRKGIVAYTPHVKHLTGRTPSFGVIGRQIVQAVQHWQQLMWQVCTGKLLPKAYCSQRFEHEIQLYQLRNGLMQALIERGLVVLLQKRTPCLECGRKDLCKHKKLDGWQAPKHNSNELSGNNSSHPGGAA